MQFKGEVLNGINDYLVAGGMVYMRMHIFISLLVLFAMSIGSGHAQNVDIGDVEAFKQALEQDGFTVQQGGLTYFDFMKLYNNGIMPSAYGNNPATQYLVYLVPPASGHEVTGKISEIIKELGVTAKVTPFWSLRPDEAVVFVGRTPSECRYFSFDQYLMERTYGNETRWIFANFGDTVNNMVIKTQGTPEGQAGNPFNQTTIENSEKPI